MWRLLSGLVLVVLLAFPWSAIALEEGTDVVVPAAARGEGLAGSQWLTSVAFENPGDNPVEVTVQWMVRGQANEMPTSVPITLAAGETRTYDEALEEIFGLDSGGGALRVVSDSPILVSAAILNRGGGAEFGQGFEGVPVTSALLAGDDSQILGVRHGDGYRTNVYLFDAGGDGATVTLTLVDSAATVLGAKTYTLQAYMPVLESVEHLGVGSVASGTIRVTVDDGTVVVGASRISPTGDPLTLEASRPAGTGGLALCFPREITGTTIRVIHPTPDMGNEVFEATADSETSITISDGYTNTTAPITYRPFGTGAIVLTDIPDFNLRNVRAALLCASETTATVVASADTPYGPVSLAAKVEILQQ